MLHGEKLRLPHTKGPQNLYCLFYAPYQRSTFHSNHNLEIQICMNPNHLRYHGLESHSVLIRAIFGSAQSISTIEATCRISFVPSVEWFNIRIVDRISKSTDIVQQVVREYAVVCGEVEI